jgi:hypothetical protein
MKPQLLKSSSILFVVIFFSLMTGIALAEKKHWFVVKDKDGLCRVIEAETVVEPFKKLAGPFKTMKEAEKRKAKECPKRPGQATEQLRPQQEQVERMRPQHEQREEPEQQHLNQKQTPHEQQQQAPQQQQTEKLHKQQQQSAPQHQEQTEKVKGKTQEKSEVAKPSEEKVKEKTKELIPSDKKN